MRAAFYTGTRPGVPGLYNRLVRSWEPGGSSHAELIFSDGVSASASFMDKGVRFKEIDYDPTKWEIIDLGERFNEDYARQWFELHEDEPYNLLGQIHFVVSPVRIDGGYWCSAAMAAALQLVNPWRYGPNLLRDVLVSIVTKPPKGGFLLPQQ
jgi:hypothetical protein